MYLKHLFPLDQLWKWCHRLLCQRRCSLTRVIFIITLLILISLLFMSYRHGHWTTESKRRQYSSPPTPITTCNLMNKPKHERGPNNHDTQGNLRIGRKVLIMVDSPFSRNAKNIAASMEFSRFPYKIVDDEKNLPTLIHMGKGRFGVIVFETMALYLSLDSWNRQLIDKYCQEYNVGVIFFMKPRGELEVLMENVQDFSFSVQYNIALKDYSLNTASDVWRITKPGEVIKETFPEEDWAVFYPNHSTFEPLAFATQTASLYDDYDPLTVIKNKTVFPAILDTGKNDGIRRVFFGHNFSFWLHSLLLLDSISFLSHGKLSLGLERLIQIDIDDIFVGAKGTRMKAHDVVALYEAQERLKQEVDGFRFMLGFSGWYYQHGTEEENIGDETLLKYRNHFNWFPHMWRHEQPHKFTEDELLKNMALNYQFAKDYKIPVVHQYAVAPHHSGVFPVHESLYNSWKSVWDIRVTSTEEYPKLHPSWGRRGFVHSGIMVLPRQTCGLFTHTIFLNSYPGGPARLEKSIYGGELFKAFLYNPLNIFMTHLSNYGNDRLALYTFESVIKFVQCWTNLKLIQKSPMDHAIKYFDMFPEEQDPVWKNPCDHDKHLEIWSPNKTCDKFPKLLVIGPQKTGTTALYTFLSMHPLVRSNYNSKDSFEELQFFSGNNYFNGIDWYLDYFPRPNNASTEMLFEKSAGYFDNSIVPKRAHALLPNARLICILISPAKRAYSWYQHMRAHQDPVALNYTFYEIITALDTAPRQVKALRNRCLNPGVYEYHLENWLDYYSSRQ
ncbi:bifunctional heparan sulfate N-deacetylase/N-sulfotransferase-like, partial [Ruditapes philippinarum]|uniref:bifunctional heparan sulfate N-deacetylase/N-sulfotransferase-like n=1 Tax=Ruditapes philippinarum TaxID=129788 RepID=UPI00295B189B